MSSPSLNNLLRSFLDPRVPFLFIVGSLALAILGNAVYELLTNSLGAAPAFLVALIIGATAIFLFVAFSFQRLLHVLERRRVVVRNVIAPEQQAEAHAGLILPVGLNPKGPEEDIIAWHQRGGTLRHCWLLASQEAGEKVGALKQKLLEQNVTPYIRIIDDAIQTDQVYAQVRQAIHDARGLRDAAPLIADITGGTKVMTAGTLLACLDEQVAVHYWSTPRDRKGGPLLSSDGRPMKVVVHRVPEDGG